MSNIRASMQPTVANNENRHFENLLGTKLATNGAAVPSKVFASAPNLLANSSATSVQIPSTTASISTAQRRPFSEISNVGGIPTTLSHQSSAPLQLTSAAIPILAPSASTASSSTIFSIPEPVVRDDSRSGRFRVHETLHTDVSNGVNDATPMDISCTTPLAIDSKSGLPQGVPDIDADDFTCEIMEAEYVKTIYEGMSEREIRFMPDPMYMNHQREVNPRMRSITVDWLVEVHLELHLNTDTIYLCVKLMDMYLSRVQVERRRLQLVAVTALMIACKVEEIYSPSVLDFVNFCDNAYSRANILEMEAQMLNTLDFNVTHPTPIYFLRRFVKAADGDTELKHLACYFMELTMLDAEMLRYTPSQIAAASLYLANQLTHRGDPRWTATMEHYSRYSADALLPIVQHIRNNVRNEATSSLRAVWRKYEHVKFTRAAVRARSALQMLAL
eukprot:TRINITY_DN4500_c0_g1_i1.p1 TRINITY_DN4500_c0_g1~~TRINITY_DN4500_c0_g1_i1.p1  ORF type:complete len:446 (-),score=97.65 TRINITY_DN4500_c0_g1_i1:122-1459(-)